MGFKCPVCHNDFKTDKTAWLEHCATEHNGIGMGIVSIVTKTAGKEEDAEH